MVHVLEFEGQISTVKFVSLLERAKEYARNQSDALLKVKNAFGAHGQANCKRFEEKDFNKDGRLGFDGFQAALLFKENNVNHDELQEAFNLICDRESQIHYRDWVLSIFSNYSEYFTIANPIGSAPSEKDDLNERESFAGEAETPKPGASAPVVDQYVLDRARTKLENFIRA